LSGQARWPQDVANLRKKLKSLNFSRGFAVTGASQSHAAWAWQALGPQDVAMDSRCSKDA